MPYENENNLLEKSLCCALRNEQLPGKERFQKALRSLPRELWTRTSSYKINITYNNNNNRIVYS